MIDHETSLKNLADKNIIRPTFKFEVKWNGSDWVDESEYVVEEITGMQDKNFDTSSINIQDLNLVLDNTSNRFDPEIGTVKDYISQPNREVRLWLGYSDYNVQLFTGRIKKVKPDPKSRTVTLECWDFADKFQTEVYTDSVLENKKTSELLTEIMTELGISGSEYSFDVGEITVKISAFSGENAWDLIQLITQAERGRIFLSSTGILTFWNRTTLKRNSVVPVEELSTDLNVVDIYPTYDYDKVVKKVKVTAVQRKITAALENIFVLGRVEGFATGEEKTFFCKFTDQVTQEEFFAKDVANASFTANTLEDGTGTNITANFAITSETKRAAITILTIKNNYGSPGFLTALTIQGKPAKIVSTIQVEQESATVTEGITLEFENPFVDSIETANTIAYEELERRENVYSYKTAEIAGAYPYLETGDIVTVVDTTKNITDRLEIASREIDFGEALLVTYKLIRALTPRYFLELSGLVLSDSHVESGVDVYYYGNGSSNDLVAGVGFTWF